MAEVEPTTRSLFQLLIPPPEERYDLRYGFALLTVALAAGIQLVLRDMFTSAPFFLFWVAMVSSALYGGFGPGMVAGIVSIPLINYFFQPPANAFALDAASLFQLLVFAIVTLLISASQAQRLHLERRLREQNDWFSTTLASIADAVIATDARGHIQFINSVAENLTGWSRQEVLGKPISQVFRIVNEDTYYPLKPPVLQALEQRKFFGHSDDALLIKRDGSEIPISSSGAPILDAQRQAIGAVLVFHDVTAQRALEQQKEALLEQERRARTRAEEADKLKLKFLGMISHELRTPLTAIKGFATTLLSDDVHWDAQQQYEFAGIINTESDKLTGLIEDLLDLSKLEAGTFRVECKLTTVKEILQNARPVLDRVAKDHPLQIALPDVLPPILADGRRIEQVLNNLVSNAAKYSFANTPIQVTAKAQEHTVQVSVSDGGLGVTPEDRELVFEAFRQVERKEAGKHGGAGLGLAICKGIIEAHNGRIWIEDRPAPGTTISFTLPLAEKS